jgi:hypothetical protein
MALAGQGGAFERIQRDVDARAAAQPDLLADVEHRRLVALALADDDAALDVERVQRRAHGVHRGLVGLLLVAAADHVEAGDGRGLADAHGGQRQVTVEHVRRGGGRRGGHGGSSGRDEIGDSPGAADRGDSGRIREWAAAG